ncbi:MAG TPA: pyridoxal phosphate-dependent aminotransferase [Verrucomicrobiae bacterium]|nr:pyridoxal phosphate-dependent aminotransferase [Verrucomicrobiae bacterium]
MSPQRREIRSAFIEWAKLRSNARFDLSGSSVLSIPLAEFPVPISSLEISGPAAYGYPPLLDRLAAKSGVPVECIIQAEGTSMANHLAMAALIEAGDEVLIEDPGYEPLVTAAHYLGARIRRFARRPDDNFQLDPREIERVISSRTRLIVLTNLHNPSGARASDASLRLVGEIARSLGGHVLVDEIFLECCFDSPWQTAFHLGPNFIATGSLAKAYGLPGLRCGWVFAAAPLAQRMWRLNDLFGVYPPHVAELLSVIALDHLPKLVARARSLLDANRALLRSFLDSRKDLLGSCPSAGPICFPQVASGPALAFCQLLREKYETSVVPGRFFGAPRHFRLGIGGNTDGLREGLARLSAALDEFATPSGRSSS